MTPSIITRIGKAGSKFIAVRLLWLSWLFGVACGCWLAVAWVFTLHYAPEIAVELIARVM